MILHVLSVRSTQHKILWGVVSSIMVFVVGFFSFFKVATNRRFNDNDMFKDISFSVGSRVCWNQQFSISFFQDERSLSGFCGTPHGAIS